MRLKKLEKSNGKILTLYEYKYIKLTIMEQLSKIIETVKQIDKDLDAYSYSGIPYEEYVEMKKRNISGPNGLRNLIKYNSGCVHIWAGWMQACLDDIKKTINNIYLIKKGKNINIDKKEIKILVSRIQKLCEAFNKSTDNCSIYPIQSERIIKNMKIVSEYIIKNNY